MSNIDGGRRVRRQDTFDLRNDIVPDEQHSFQEHQDSLEYEDSVEQDRSVIEEDDDDEDDISSTLSIPNESIDFDLVYSLHTFVATVEGQANVVKGDSLFLMDDSNSYWWLVRVLKTQEIGYIPAENIETPFERLARLNKHRNVDLASATVAEQQDDLKQSRERMRNALAARGHGNGANPTLHPSKSVIFTGSSVYYYPPFVWGDPSRALEDGDEIWDDDDDDASYESGEEGEEAPSSAVAMEPDDGMSWEDDVGEHAQALSQGSVGTVSDADVSSAVHLQSTTVDQHMEPSRQTVAAQQADLGVGRASTLRTQTSRERVAPPPSSAPTSTSSREFVDPAQVMETKKLTVTPSIAREDVEGSSNFASQQHDHMQRSYSISSVVSGASSADSTSSKRPRDDGIETDTSDGKRAKGKAPEKKLRKDRGLGGDSRDSHESLERPSSISGEREKERKKKVGMFGNLFGKKRDKKEKDGKRPLSSADKEFLARSSAESILNTTEDVPGDPSRVDTDTSINEGRSSFGVNQPPSRQTDSPVSAHTIRMQQKDREQQLLFSQSLKRSPSSPPDASSSYGLQTAASQQLDNGLSMASLGPGGLAPAPRNTRPGSLILTTSVVDGASTVPDLSVLRVFAGDHLQSEATFKTVLINASTTSADLVRQAMQRFRLPQGEEPNDYYLTVKQLGGDEAALRPEEHPLEAFEQLVERAMSIPTVKRSSVGSISSLASNLSMHPAITKLGMNDFTDDSTVKFYLHRSLKTGEAATREEEVSLRGSFAEEYESDNPIDDALPASTSRNLLSVATSGLGFGSVSPERFSSPSARFAVQIMIYPDDLPDGMVFDPHTEAIVPRSTLQHRSGSSATISPGVPQTHRRKIFIFPKNTTVAEVIEASLERFGIVEGVVEGGDDVEDKLAKRRSSSRIRYGLAVSYSDSQQRELQPSSKVLDAFIQPPIFKVVDRRSTEFRRRSGESSQLLGTADDIQSDDPSFILRRAVGFRNVGNSRSKLANSLDEVALQHLHRDSASSEISQSSSIQTVSLRGFQKSTSRHQGGVMTLPNAEQGTDVVLRDRGILRSCRGGDDTTQYFWISHRGERIDITASLEQEWGARVAVDDPPPRESVDLLEVMLTKPITVQRQDIDRLLARVQTSTSLQVEPPYPKDGNVSPSVYSENAPSRNASRTGTPSGAPLHTAFPEETEPQTSRSQSVTPTTNRVPQVARAGVTGSRATSPISGARQLDSNHQQHPSIASVLSDLSTYTTASNASASNAVSANQPSAAAVGPDDSSLSRMLAVIESNARSFRTAPRPMPSLLDETFLGVPINLEELHPQARECFEPSVRQMAEVEKRLDRLLLLASGSL